MVKAAKNKTFSTKNSNRQLLIEKIGGTSMIQFTDVMQNILFNAKSYYGYLSKGYACNKKKNFLPESSNLYPPQSTIKAEFPYGRVFVVSAYAGITDLLLEGKKNGKPGIYHWFVKKKALKKEMEVLLQHFFSINRKFKSLGLNISEANNFIEQRISDSAMLLDTLDRALTSGYILRENILLAAREILASIGESHSAFNSANILQNNGFSSQFIDLGGHLDHRPLTIDERIAEAAKKMKPLENVVVVTGYVKGVEGIMRKYDRGYSDITFSKMAVRLEALEAIIHKEYHLSSADPAIIGAENALPVGNTNYDVADQLADVGMEAIHPNASKALEISNINLRVKNTFEPEHAGTLITRNYKGKKAKVEIITGSDKFVLVEIHDPRMVGAIGFDATLSNTIAEAGLSFTFKSTNANSISHLFWEHKITDDFIETLKKQYHTVTLEKVAVVCVIGTNIAIPGILSKTATVLSSNNINIMCISQSLRQVNIQFVIARKHYHKAILQLHRELCEKPNSNS